ncbi:hypothetical conserved protein [Candidatus Nitrosoglobus terrae]|uniref:Hypothetical conserved protein n=1 Tax=Candidatus Nitrosoglobus terrae TaxID=1630141 RepID=A0A1Q2SKJ3_9GAMM|nr:hypothetical protein [Candidatus Nitrosoglobus terrae]BAW79639.1 hypothetical conserved protein [Candidatus Nitrosoglobus terrae]
MALNIEVFSNTKGGQSLFKALGHPLIVTKAHALLDRLADRGPVAIYDPLNQIESFAALYNLSRLNVVAVFVQEANTIGEIVLGQEAKPVTELQNYKVAAVFLVAFDAGQYHQQIKHLIPAGAEVFTLDALRLPDDMLTNRSRYLDPLNFATNFALFRDMAGQHTRLVTANYWAGYGARDSALWLCLYNEVGEILAQWQIPLSPAVHSIVIDSRQIRERFGLDDFVGTLFLHGLRIAGHDVVKYALDIYGENEQVLSCTHDANAWPAELYAGLPAPAVGEKVILWVQNSHPCPIPAGKIGLNLLGSSQTAWLNHEIPPFGTYALNVAELIPEAIWPQQLEVQAGKYFVRPRYEVITANNHQRIAHANVERVDLKPDVQISKLKTWLGKGYLLPAPVLPQGRWQSLILPTPMATSQQELPVKLLIYDASGQEITSHTFGIIARSHSVCLDIDAVLERKKLPGGYGHMELMYDFKVATEVDGWLHGLFRYRDRVNNYSAETSFGSHIFNTILTYKDEPQSYTGRPPGLSTRLFLRLGSTSVDTFCHLIYPVSSPWHPRSDTQLVLCSSKGAEVAHRRVAIPCSGSLLWYYQDLFNKYERARAGQNAYILIRDLSCRLFGYHGLIYGDETFSLDHMFGF